MNDIRQYAKVSRDVWTVFKKYLPIGANLDTFGDDVHELDDTYKNTEYYRFMQELLKVFFGRLVRIKG